MTTTDDVIRLRQGVVAWLADYLRSNGKAGFVIGLSGGIDSLTLALMAKESALTSDSSLFALIARLDDDLDYADNDLARRMAQHYGISYEMLDLTAVYRSFKGAMFPSHDPGVYTNLKARIRTTALYYYANCRNLLVLGTVNRGEFMIGYFPKNASAGDILPMADLAKRDIRAIAETYGVPDNVRLLKASGCVHDGTAEEEWGFTEDELDVMCDQLDANFSQQIDTISHAARGAFLSLFKASDHKRRFYPTFRQ
jgi:NAD+ synthase